MSYFEINGCGIYVKCVNVFQLHIVFSCESFFQKTIVLNVIICLLVA